MANIKLDDLYPSHEVQAMNEITDREIKSINGGFMRRISPASTNNSNDESLVNMFAQNLSGMLWNLRSQMDLSMFNALNQVGNNLEFL